MPSLVTLVDGTVPVAADFNGNYTALNNAIGSSTSISAWATGEIPYASSTNTLSRLSPGSVGKVLTMGATVPGWEGGAWFTPAFSASDFTASGSMTWTVGSGDVTTYASVVVGKVMTVNFLIQTTTVGGTPGTGLRIAIPGGKVSTKSVQVPIRTVDNGTPDTGWALVAASGTTIECQRNAASGNWSASTDNTSVMGSITFEIN